MEGPGIHFGPGPLTQAVKQLLIANVAVFLASQIIPLPWTETFGLVPHAIVHRLWLWQLGTYLFIHGGFMHIIMNMFALWMFGVPLEREWGYRAFMGYYFLTGIGAVLSRLLVIISLVTRSHISTRPSCNRATVRPSEAMSSNSLVCRAPLVPCCLPVVRSQMLTY